MLDCNSWLARGLLEGMMSAKHHPNNFTMLKIANIARKIPVFIEP